MTRAESEGVQEQYVYFPGCLETQGEADASGKGIVVFERVRGRFSNTLVVAMFQVFTLV